MTKKEYLDDAYAKTLNSRIIRKFSKNKNQALILEETIFYPSSGGQLHDCGSISGYKVLDVFEENDDVVHLIDGEIDETNITGEIDWERRFDNMQQHTGQHILSKCIENLLGAKTLSVHMGTGLCTIDIERESITRDEIRTVEMESNTWIYKNVPVSISYPDDQELRNMPLRKQPPEGKKVRIISIEGLDLTPCGGTHCKRTGEVGIIKIIGSGKMRGKVRLEFYCGSRAVRDYLLKNDIVMSARGLLATTDEQIVEKLNKILEENKEKDKLLNKLQKEAVTAQAQKYFDNGEMLTNFTFIKAIFDASSIGEMQMLAKQIGTLGESVILFGSKNDTGAFVFYSTTDSYSDMSVLLDKLRSNYAIRGGGKNQMVQGNLENSALVENFMSDGEKSIKSAVR